ncbi:MAG: hypothetical protein JKY94_11200 [Rhodobacteraceae bacterium]|nr:hypothetical protein [Paracoccaceae bacterium]
MVAGNFNIQSKTLDGLTSDFQLNGLTQSIEVDSTGRFVGNDMAMTSEVSDASPIMGM